MPLGLRAYAIPLTQSRRSLNVTLVCGANTDLRRVEEPQRCTYTAELVTPVACDDRSESEAEREVREAMRGMPGAEARVGQLMREGVARWEERVREREARGEARLDAEKEEEAEGEEEGGEGEEGDGEAGEEGLVEDASAEAGREEGTGEGEAE